MYISLQASQQEVKGCNINMANSSGRPPGSTSGISRSQRSNGPIKVGHYEIEKQIGKGNFAVVKLARHTVTGTKVRLIAKMTCAKNVANLHSHIL